MIPNLTCLTQFSDFTECTTKSDAAQAVRISDQPRRVRAWEDPNSAAKHQLELSQQRPVRCESYMCESS
jgi:hypothetical protein